jgi:desulfoferrodoxin (superoxide reductase-like protein)
MKDHVKCGTGSVKVVISMLGLFAAFSLIALCPMTAYANPPKEVKLVYNITSQKLEVTVTHETSFPGYHYINKIEIKKNGESVGVHNYQSQPTKSEFSYTYDVPASQGNVMEVTAACNLSGSKTVKLTVGKQEN